MRTKAAVALKAGEPLTVIEVELDGPKAGEVLVEIKATGICHTDELLARARTLRGFSLLFSAMKVQALWLRWAKA